MFCWCWCPSGRHSQGGRWGRRWPTGRGTSASWRGTRSPFSATTSPAAYRELKKKFLRITTLSSFGFFCVCPTLDTIKKFPHFATPRSKKNWLALLRLPKKIKLNGAAIIWIFLCKKKNHSLIYIYIFMVKKNTWIVCFFVIAIRRFKITPHPGASLHSPLHTLLGLESPPGRL